MEERKGIESHTLLLRLCAKQFQALHCVFMLVIRRRVSRRDYSPAIKTPQPQCLSTWSTLLLASRLWSDNVVVCFATPTSRPLSYLNG